MSVLLSTLRDVVAVASVFVVCVVIHEFGHYIVAKRCGVAVPAFAVGFGPKLVKWVRGGTEFSIRLLPLGGLVQLAGEVPQDAFFRKGEVLGLELAPDGRVTRLGDPDLLRNPVVGTLSDLNLTDRLEMTMETDQGLRTFRLVPHARLMTAARHSVPLVERHEQVLGKPLWQRALIILAGPLMNFLLAGVLFSVFFMHAGIPLGTSTLGQIVPGSAAAQAGLMQGDRVISINGKRVNQWNDLVAAIRTDTSNPPRPLSIQVERSGMSQTYVVTPRRTHGYPELGVNEPVSYSPALAWKSGFTTMFATSVNAVHLYYGVIVHHQFNNLSGPVGIADVISQQASISTWMVVMIAGLLSLNLGLFNLLPFPALDGGRLLFMVVEMVRGKSVDPRKESLVHFVGFALLMLFAVVITYRDVTRLF